MNRPLFPCGDRWNLRIILLRRWNRFHPAIWWRDERYYVSFSMAGSSIRLSQERSPLSDPVSLMKRHELCQTNAGPSSPLLSSPPTPAQRRLRAVSCLVKVFIRINVLS